MSATLDANLISDYFQGCPVLEAQGRTFPVVHHFLEDAYEAVQHYKIERDSPVALRGSSRRAGGGTSAAAAAVAAAAAAAQLRQRQGHGAAVAGLADGAAQLAEEDLPIMNPYYDPDAFRWESFCLHIMMCMMVRKVWLNVWMCSLYCILVTLVTLSMERQLLT